jgi:hypothetical protein
LVAPFKASPRAGRTKGYIRQPDSIRLIDFEVSIEEILCNGVRMVAVRRPSKAASLDRHNPVIAHDARDTVPAAEFAFLLAKIPGDARAPIGLLASLKARTRKHEQPLILLLPSARAAPTPSEITARREPGGFTHPAHWILPAVFVNLIEDQFFPLAK